MMQMLTESNERKEKKFRRKFFRFFQFYIKKEMMKKKNKNKNVVFGQFVCP